MMQPFSRLNAPTPLAAVTSCERRVLEQRRVTRHECSAASLWFVLFQTHIWPVHWLPAPLVFLPYVAITLPKASPYPTAMIRPTKLLALSDTTDWNKGGWVSHGPPASCCCNKSRVNASESLTILVTYCDNDKAASNTLGTWTESELSRPNVNINSIDN